MSKTKRNKRVLFRTDEFFLAYATKSRELSGSVLAARLGCYPSYVSRLARQPFRETKTTVATINQIAEEIGFTGRVYKEWPKSRS